MQKKTFAESMRQEYYGRTILYIAVFVTLIFVTQLLEVLLRGGC